MNECASDRPEKPPSDSADDDLTPCPRCGAPFHPIFNFCPNCGLDRSANQAWKPERSKDVPFARDLFTLSWYSHHITAQHLANSLGNPAADDIDVSLDRHLVPDAREKILRAKLWSEKIALLESLGMLCLMIRHRRTKSMIWSY